MLFTSSTSWSMQFIAEFLQVSHLDPLVFHFSIKDLPTCVQASNLLIFSDDVKSFTLGKYNNMSLSFKKASNLYERFVRYGLLYLYPQDGVCFELHGFGNYT